MNTPVESYLKYESGFEARAASFATKAHLGQVRKYSNEPYIVHPAEVAGLVRTVPHTNAMLAAAWLHDVIEDCGVTEDQLAREFNMYVAGLVDWLTDVSLPGNGNRKLRKALDRRHIQQAPAEAKTVKLADLISNSRTIVQHDPGFSRVYMEEKRELLKVLKEGDRGLWDEANRIVEGYYQGLNNSPAGREGEL